jgi:hypothetical protein
MYAGSWCPELNLARFCGPVVRVVHMVMLLAIMEIWYYLLHDLLAVESLISTSNLGVT